MKNVAVIKILSTLDAQGRYLFTYKDLAVLFNEQGNTLNSTIKRLSSDGVLDKVTYGLYEFLLSSTRMHRNILGDAAVTLRRGEVTYESLECAASQWGLISQIPLGGLTCVTTGKSGEFKTKYGRIEFVHTDKRLDELAGCCVTREPTNRLPLATEQASLDDLLYFQRSLDLIDWEIAEEDGVYHEG